ncbi:TadG family pilus assembly protein [Variovorax sp. J2P1-31]|nr:TadG family pilus assembly protein [Variovorax sp. J2P1-31]MDM0087711.1 TadG family pilus assembly protein [Variovorax sp. J22G40]MDM0144032.1 TadG family pilus assembly protein [Variovorax sp. J2P1-31]
MPLFHRNRKSSPNRQGGSVVVNAAIAISLLVILLIGSELGYLSWMKRDLQKAADLAALAGAQKIDPNSCGAAIDAAKRNANGTDKKDPTRNLSSAFSLEDTEISCGQWSPTASDATGRHFISGMKPFNAVRVYLQKTPALLFPNMPGNSGRTIVVEAIASMKHPQAALSIRSTLININDDRAALLNLVTSALLGGAVKIGAVGWNGLLDANINILDYLIALDANAGNYESILNSRVSLAKLLKVGATVIKINGSLVDAKAALNELSLAAEIKNLDIRVGDLLGVASGTPFSALAVDLQAFGLAQGAIQLANGESALAADLNLSLLGLGNFTSKIKVIEKPQLSGIGNPNLVNPMLGTSDPQRIFVRTAQVRTLHTLELKAVTGLVNNLVKVLLDALSPLVNFLNTVTSLNLGKILTELVGLVVCAPCDASKVIYTTVLPDAGIDIGIEGSAGSAYVTNHTCAAESKSLVVQGKTSLAAIRIGKIKNAFSSDPISVEPIPLVKIGYSEQRYTSCLLSLICFGKQYKNEAGQFVAYPASLPVGSFPSDAKKTLIAGFGLSVDLDVSGSSSSPKLTYSSPLPENLPEIDAAPYSGTAPDPSYQSINVTDVVGSLGSAIGGVKISPYQSDAGGALGALLTGSIQLISNLISSLSDLLKTALSPLLDPLVKELLRVAGIDLATTQIGARLSCNRGAEIVY